MPKSYENLARDGSQAVLQTGTGIVTVDISGTPKASPLALTTATSTIAVPLNCAEMVIYCTTAVRISEDSTMTRYFIVPASTSWVIPLGKTDTFYLAADSGTPSLFFYFVKVA